MIYTVPAPRITDQHQVLGYLWDREKDNPQGSEFNQEGLETAWMAIAKPFEGLGESQDANNGQEEFQRYRL